MSGLPGFLRAAPGAPMQASAPPVRAGSLGLAMQPAPWRWTLLHDRPEAVLIWVTRGSGRVVVNGIRRGVAMHSAVFLPAGTLFALDLPAGVQALCLQCPAGLPLRLPQEPQLLRVRDSRAQAELTGEIDAMTRERAAGQARMADALEARMRLVSVWLHRQRAAGAADSPPDTATTRLVRRFAMAVARDFAQARPVAAHAADLDVTPTHLSRVCRAACGRTAADMLTERRLHAARSALEAPRPAISRIAADLGFASPAYFSRFMQTHTGHSPTALRRAARDAAARAHG